MARRKKNELEEIVTSILDAMADKKAWEPVVLDFTKLTGTLCDTFVICHGTSGTQVAAIADHVITSVKKKTGINPWHLEGLKNAEWILIDYSNVVVHIFLEDRRRFFNLEHLWADAEIRRIETMVN